MASDTPRRFKKRPVEIDALQFRPDTVGEVLAFCPGANYTNVPARGEIQIVQHILVIPGWRDDIIATAGDWIIRGASGEFSTCKPERFDATYEPAGE